MTASIASEVAEVKKTQEFKVVVFNEITGYANMLCIAVWLRVKRAGWAHEKQHHVQTHTNKAAHALITSHARNVKQSHNANIAKTFAGWGSIFQRLGQQNHA